MGEERNMNRKKKFCCLIALALCVAIAAGGCKSEEPRFTVTMMAELFPSFETVDQTSWLRAIESYTDTEIRFMMVPTLEYVSQVEQLLRSDKLPMVVTANENILDKESFHAYLKAGGFWNLEDYLDEFPDLKEFIGEEVWENSRIQGHIYGIPRLRIQPRYTAYYRKDWADKLGLKAPETLDEIYRMLKAFTELDPDGNGLADTVGLTNSWQKWRAREWNGIETVTTAIGGPNGWKYEESKGEMIPDFATEEYRETLAWFRTLYEEGILDHSFPFLTPVQRQEQFIQGYAGMIFGVIDDAPEMEDRLRQINPEAEVAVLPAVRQEGQPCRVNSTAGYNGLILFNRLGDGAIRTEEELRQVLGFYDRLCGGEGQELLIYGTEGEFYTRKEDGEKELIYKEGNNRSVLAAAVGSYAQIMPMPAYVRTPGDSGLQKEVYDCIEEREKWLVRDDSFGLYSETYTMYGDQLNQRMQKASIRYIMGEITEDGYLSEYEAWYQAGGKKVIEEYTKAYTEAYTNKVIGSN